MNERLDKYLSNTEELTRTQAVKLIEAGNCIVNGVVITSKKHIVDAGDIVEVEIPEAELVDVLPEDIPLDVRYEDEDVIVLNKPRGMVVHPAPRHYMGTLVNALMFHCGNSLSGINGIIRPGIVHRIDKDTSGLIIVAKNDNAHLSLAEQLKKHTMTREYEAVVHGQVKNESGTVDAPIGRSVSDRKKMCITTKNSRAAITHYEVIARYDKFTHIRLKLETGRTHQIRVHMNYIGHSVAGDMVYGNPKQSSKYAFLNGQCLHARKLFFFHPVSGRQVEVACDLPDYFMGFLERIK